MGAEVIAVIDLPVDRRLLRPDTRAEVSRVEYSFKPKVQGATDKKLYNCNLVYV